jgi:PAS domain S-box-containing protein
MQQIDRKQLYDRIINGLPVALFVVDSSFRIVEFNHAAEEISGWSREEVIGRYCGDVLAGNLCGENCLLRRSENLEKPCIGKEAFITTKDQKKLPILFSSSGLSDDNGNMLNGIIIFRDASEIKKLEAQKKNIISLFTHDLKSPVAIAGGFVARLLEGKAGPLTEKQHQYLETINREISRLENYILSFLEISRIESGQMELVIKPLEISGLLRESIEGFRLQAAKKDITLQLEMADDLPLLRGDCLQIARVIANLLDNAIKYSQAGTTVQVRVTSDASSLTIEVTDQGIGMAPEQLEYIFDPFYRIRGSTQDAGGTGLGLAAVRAIVKAHGGTTRVSSELGRGSSFFVSFPL